MDVLSLSSLVGFRGGSTWESKWLVFAMVGGAKLKGQPAGRYTMDVVWMIILWCFRVLLSGVWPARDWNREPFYQVALGT